MVLSEHAIKRFLKFLKSLLEEYAKSLSPEKVRAIGAQVELLLTNLNVTFNPTVLSSFVEKVNLILGGVHLLCEVCTVYYVFKLSVLVGTAAGSFFALCVGGEVQNHLKVGAALSVAAATSVGVWLPGMLLWGSLAGPAIVVPVVGAVAAVPVAVVLGVSFGFWKAIK